MKKKILQLKIEAEKFETLKTVKAGALCCWDNGCDCTANPSRFESKFNIWIDLMDALDAL
jgi:hypothetical protein